MSRGNKQPRLLGLFAQLMEYSGYSGPLSKFYRFKVLLDNHMTAVRIVIIFIFSPAVLLQRYGLYRLRMAGRDGAHSLVPKCHY